MTFENIRNGYISTADVAILTDTHHDKVVDEFRTLCHVADLDFGSYFVKYTGSSGTKAIAHLDKYPALLLLSRLSPILMTSIISRWYSEQSGSGGVDKFINNELKSV